MSDAKPTIGSFAWFDLTVQDAERIRDFYSSVVGWTTSAVSMGDYEDYCMQTPPDGQTVAGICHARGVNAKLPAQWLIYILVNDLDKSVAQCQELGGRVLDGPRAHGESKFAVIQDPAGACVALYQR